METQAHSAEANGQSSEPNSFTPEWRLGLELGRPLTFLPFGSTSLQMGLTYKATSRSHLRLELGYDVLSDSLWDNVLQQSKGPYSRLLYGFGLGKYVTLWAGWQVGTYAETYDVHLPGTNFADYNTQTTFNEQWHGPVLGGSVSYNLGLLNGALILKTYSYIGSIYFADTRQSEENFTRRSIPGFALNSNQFSRLHDDPNDPDFNLGLNVGVELQYVFGK